MNDLRHRAGGLVAATGLLLLAATGLAHLAGARINTTHSVPVGLYWVTNGAIEKGVYVVFCPPPTAIFTEARGRGYINAGPCPGGFGHMMKRVSGRVGDEVELDNDGVRVNGRILPLSAPRAEDGAGRAMPRCEQCRFTLSAGELLLMSDVSATSFDARYFGPIAQSSVRAVVRPVLTW